MLLSELLRRAGGDACTARLPVDPHLTGLTDDSRAVRPGNLFVAVRGCRVDGHAFVPAAVSAGAAGVVVERPVEAPGGVACVMVDDSAAWLGRAAMAWHGLDEVVARGAFPMVGVTGTNGKTTTAYLVREMLADVGRRVAMIGTVICDLVGRTMEASLTTPGALQLAALLAEARGHGAAGAVLEVSSHSLAQRRVDGLSFAAAVFTNLTGDHLDYHGTMAAYAAAKKRLFDGLAAGAWAIVNGDDPAADTMVRDCGARRLRFGFGAQADLRGEILSMTPEGTVLRAQYEGRREEVRTPLLGRHNGYNVLAAVGAGLALGLDLAGACDGAARLRSVRGRLERVPTGGLGFSIVVDYAHTDDALRNVLAALRPITRGKLWCVFGCGGDRDRTKRPRMARAAQEGADRVIVTSDNPRGEDPTAIIDDIRAGFDRPWRDACTFEVDRARAIAQAVAHAQPGDVVLIAGKGHETYQIVGDRKLPFDDVQAAAEAVRRRLGTPAADACRGTEPCSR